MNQDINYQAVQTQPENTKTACLAVGIYRSRKLSLAAEIIDQTTKGYLRRLLQHGDFDGTPGKTLTLYNVPNIQAKRLMLVGCGQPKKLTLKEYQTIQAAFAKAVARLKVSDAVSFLVEIESKHLDKRTAYQHAVLDCSHALYQFIEFKNDASLKPKHKLKKIKFAQTDRKGLAQYSATVAQAAAIAEGASLARTLGNLPGNICTPGYLAKQAQSLQRKYRTVKTSVLDEATMKKLGMHALLSVSRGSREPAKLIIMEYKRGNKNGKPVVIVGKGITFDSGGISIKPVPQMDEMKFDMCGAASVLGTMTACAKMQLKANVIGVIAAAENMPGSNASKPGDIVKSYAGKTIEILNTDAEGRLVLCDSLSYVEQYNPSVVIDIATLTGACIIALGHHPSGMLSNNSKLAERLQRAGERSGDRVWPLPLWPEYRDQLKSNFADIANIGGRDAGTITAASFLSYFTESYPWAHLDIAGTAWKSGKLKGATGRPVRLLLEYIMTHHVTRN